MSTVTFYDSIVTVQYFEETITKGGLRRFLFGVERTTGESLLDRRIGLATLDPWKASLCKQALEQGLTLHIKHRKTRWFDDTLLFVEVVHEKKEISLSQND